MQGGIKYFVFLKNISTNLFSNQTLCILIGIDLEQVTQFTYNQRKTIKT